MRKSALILAIIMVAAAPATVFAKKAPADPNAPAKKFATTGLQQPLVIWNGMWSPWWVAKKK
jgi:hypothetical protein